MVLSKIQVEAKPQEGDYKITQHFALFPKVVDGYRIWLEMYKKIFEWRIRDRSVVAHNGFIFKFKDCGAWDLIKEQRITNENNSIRQQ